VLAGFETDSRQALFAHCVGLTLNAVVEPYNRRPKAVAHADRIAAAVDLDMTAAGWEPTVENFLGRVTKPRILLAVREARGEPEAERIEHLKKGEMAAKAQEQLAGSGWLPEPLRTPGRPLAGGSNGEEPASPPPADREAAAGDPGVMAAE
jgi:ParB family chromosome partitioning protein